MVSPTVLVIFNFAERVFTRGVVVPLSFVRIILSHFLLIAFAASLLLGHSEVVLFDIVMSVF